MTTGLRYQVIHQNDSIQVLNNHFTKIIDGLWLFFNI